MRLVDEGYITLTYNDPIPEAGFLIFNRSVFEGYSHSRLQSVVQ